MNLIKLFETQKVLRDRIDYNEPDRFNKLVLALLVEIGECANEWRGFKFWSKDQKPRTKGECVMCDGFGNDIYYTGSLEAGTLQECSEPCEYCDGMGNDDSENPLLEEYVDGLHFVLELGLEFGFQKTRAFLVRTDFAIEKMFLKLNKIIAQFVVVEGREHKEFYFGELLSNYLGLGKMLGFTWEEIEQAYFAKNQINHQRQSEGY